MTKKPERKSLSIVVEYPAFTDEDRIEIIRKSTAEVIGDKITREIYEQIGPNYFEVLTGWIVQPGAYRVNIDFSISKQIERGPYSVG